MWGRNSNSDALTYSLSKGKILVIKLLDIKNRNSHLIISFYKDVLGRNRIYIHLIYCRATHIGAE
jgi:hypothetical protein